MKSRFIFLWLMMLFGSYVYGQVADLGSYGFRLVKTVKNADFDYERLDTYFRNPDRLDSLGRLGASIFEPKDGYYIIYEFLGDVVTENVMTSEGGVKIAYVPAVGSRQKLLLLKVNESRTIVDGYLMPYDSPDSSLSSSLFCVRTREYRLIKDFDIQALNLRNLYDKEKRVDNGSVFLNFDMLSKYDKDTAPENWEFSLVKKVLQADFDYVKLNDFDNSVSYLLTQKESNLSLFEPIAGDYIFYQFIANVVVEERCVPQGKFGDYGSFFADKLEEFLSVEAYVPYFIDAEYVLIVKTDLSGTVIDGYLSPLAMDYLPYSSALYRVGRKGVRLRDGMPLHELGFRNDDVLLSKDVGKISLFPK